MQTYITPDAAKLRKSPDEERERGKHRNLEHYIEETEEHEVYCTTSEREAYLLAGYDITNDVLAVKPFAHFLGFLALEFNAVPEEQIGTSEEPVNGSVVCPHCSNPFNIEPDRGPTRAELATIARGLLSVIDAPVHRDEHKRIIDFAREQLRNA